MNDKLLDAERVAAGPDQHSHSELGNMGTYSAHSVDRGGMTDHVSKDILLVEASDVKGEQNGPSSGLQGSTSPSRGQEKPARAGDVLEAEMLQLPRQIQETRYYRFEGRLGSAERGRLLLIQVEAEMGEERRLGAETT